MGPSLQASSEVNVTSIPPKFRNSLDKRKFARSRDCNPRARHKCAHRADTSTWPICRRRKWRGTGRKGEGIDLQNERRIVKAGVARRRDAEPVRKICGSFCRRRRHSDASDEGTPISSTGLRIRGVVKTSDKPGTQFATVR